MYPEIGRTSLNSQVCRTESQIGIIVILLCLFGTLKVSGQEPAWSYSQSTDNTRLFGLIDVYESYGKEVGRNRSKISSNSNGTNVKPGSYPSIGVLFNKKVNICGAVLISPNVALCGCHCLIEETWRDWRYPHVLTDPHDIAVLIDCVDFSNIRGQMRGAEKVKVHPDCSKTITEVTYNYGLVKFTEPFLRIFGFVETVDIPNYGTTALIDEMIQNEEPCAVVGWSSQRGKSPRMQEFKAKLRHHKWCNLTVHYLTEFNEGGPDIYLPDHQFCVSPLQDGPSGCFGNNIGPLFCGVEYKFIIGIFSFVAEADICGSNVLPTVGSRLDVVYNWIEAFVHKQTSDEERSLAAIHPLNYLHFTSSLVLLLCTMYIA